ncbi:DUF2982 domain-containing protein [Shewanella sp. YIC-542]|uniref:DUF2982 domain-containing protein n=1 Tax=Shewanella mytili TaxID=3377111 RepID=UPI00398F1D4F
MKCEPVVIPTNGKRNAMTLTVAGIVGVFLGMVLFIGWRELFAVALLCFAAGLISLLLGIAKQLEPEVMLRLDDSGLTYFHRRGQLRIGWDNIQRLDLLRIQRGLEWLTLPYMGVKVVAVNPVLDEISPRLATGLLSEQRALMMTAVANDEALQHLEHYLSAEFEPLLVNGERYRGLLAMFGRRCLTLDEHLGFHLYIPLEFLPMAPEVLLKRLRAFKQQQLLEKDS